MKGYFIDKGSEVGVYRGGFDENWIVKDRHSFVRTPLVKIFSLTLVIVT